MKKILALMLTLAMLLTLAACSGEATEPTENAGTQAAAAPAEKEDGKVKMTMIGGMPGGPAWGPASEGFYKACEELGWEGTYLAPTTAANQTEICELVTTAVTNGADVVLGLMYDEEMFGDLVTEYVEQGVVMIGANAGVEATNAKIGTDQTESGIIYANAVHDIVPEGEHIYSVAMMTTLSTAADEFSTSYKDTLISLRGEENCTFYDMLECQSNTQTAYDNFAAFKLSHPECNVFIAQNTYAGLGISSYIQEYGLQDSLYAIGIDDSAEVLQAVKDGYLSATVSQNFYNIGYGGVYLAKDILDGKEYEWNNPSGATLLYAADCDEWAAKLGYELD